MMQHILSKVNPANGQSTGAGKGGAGSSVPPHQREQWKKIFEKISLAAEQRCREMVGDGSAKEAAPSTRSIETQTRALEVDSETGKHTRVLSDSYSAAANAVALVEDAVHSLLILTLDLDLESVLPAETLQAFRSQLSSVPSTSIRAARNTINFIASVLKGCRVSFEDMAAKTSEAQHERDAALKHARNTDALVNETQQRLEADANRRVASERAAGEAERSQLTAEYREQLDNANTATKSL